MFQVPYTVDPVAPLKEVFMNLLLGIDPSFILVQPVLSAKIHFTGGHIHPKMMTDELCTFRMFSSSLLLSEEIHTYSIFNCQKYLIVHFQE